MEGDHKYPVKIGATVLKMRLAIKLMILAMAKVMTCLLAGAVLTEVPKRIFPRFSDPQLYKRIPPIILTSEELRSIRITQDPGDLLASLIWNARGSAGSQRPIPAPAAPL